jgi:replicative DNA helicase
MVDGSLFGLRQPPSNQQAEQALLGAILSNNKAMARCEGLTPDHFIDPVNGRIFSECQRLINAGRLADLLTLRTIFENTGFLEEAGGIAYLAGLLTATTGIINTTEYARVIADTARLRQAIDIGERLVNEAYAGGGDPQRLFLDIAADLDRLGAARRENATTTLADAMRQAEEAMARAQDGQTAGVSTGFRSFDLRLGGLEPGFVYVLAGRPSMGKSSLGHQIAMNVARAGVPVLEFSLEMSAAQLGRRTLATAANVPIEAMKSGRVNMLDAEAIVRARAELSSLPLAIIDAGGQTPGQIAAAARAQKRKAGLGLIMIDHLNLVRAEDADAKHGGTWATERASGAVLEMAKACDCPVLLLAQLSRGVEGREDKRPVLSDLRQAGAIEQDADAVGFVYRPEYYLGHEPQAKTGEKAESFAARRNDWFADKEKHKGSAEVIWAKVRDGEPGIDKLRFDAQTATFWEEPR